MPENAKSVILRLVLKPPYSVRDLKALTLSVISQPVVVCKFRLVSEVLKKAYLPMKLTLLGIVSVVKSLQP